MTITRTGGALRLTCNRCPAVAHTPDFKETEFAEMQKWITENGWAKMRRAGEWEHACPPCSKHADGRLL